MSGKRAVGKGSGKPSGFLQFQAVYAPELQAGRYLIDIPFNLWETFHTKGNFDVCCTINGVTFVCSPLPRGNGMYAISFTKAMREKARLKGGDSFTVSIGPYSGGNPRRSEETNCVKVESIRMVMQNSPKTCGQACVAMLANVTIDEAIRAMKTAGPTTSGQIIEALDFYRIGHAPKNVRLSKKHPGLPATAILTVHMPTYTHWVLYHKGRYYDPEFGLLDECVAGGRITSYLEVL